MLPVGLKCHVSQNQPVKVPHWAEVTVTGQAYEIERKKRRGSTPTKSMFGNVRLLRQSSPIWCSLVFPRISLKSVPLQGLAIGGYQAVSHSRSVEIAPPGMCGHLSAPRIVERTKRCFAGRSPAINFIFASTVFMYMCVTLS